MVDVPQYTLNDGTTLPVIGLGTWSLEGSEGAEAIAAALRAGYRLLDTAIGYRNEDAVGEGIRRSGVDREEVVVTSKIPDALHGYDGAHEAVRQTLENLGLDRVDVYLIHWPRPDRDLYVETWKAMIDLREKGKIRSIGVSNFDAEQLDRLVAETDVAPVLNQVPVHVFRQQPELRAANAARGVLTESYNPLKFGDRLGANEVLGAIAAAHDVTINQVALRWNIQLGALPVPRSRSVEHQRQNLDVFGVDLTAEELARIATIAPYTPPA